MNTAATISLFATICIDGTLHGMPKRLCQEFQVGKGYASVEACNKTRDAAVEEWLASVAFLQPHLVAVRCGPGEAGGDDI